MSSNHAEPYGPIRRYALADVTSDMAAPTTAGQFVSVAPFPEAAWYVKLGTGATGYTATLYRWVPAEAGKIGDGYVVQEDTFTSQTGSAIFRQPAWGDRIAIRIHDITGGPSGPFEVRVKGINP